MSFRRLISDELQRLQPQHPRGLTVVITGHGKGKTTAALGMALRALGHGLKVSIVQFMKGDMHAGEWDAVAKLDDSVELVATGRGFLGLQGNPCSRQQHRENAQQALNLVRDRMARGACDLLILDEINNAVHLKLVDLDQVLELIRNRPFRQVFAPCEAAPPAQQGSQPSPSESGRPPTALFPESIR